MLFTLILGVLCAVYGTIIIFISGFLEWQNYIWYVFAFCFFIMGRLITLYIKNKIPLWSVVSFYTLAALGIIIFLITGAITVLTLPKEDEEDLDYLIVLGTKPNVDRENSEVLYRLDKAIEYLDKSPDTMLVISGGLQYGGRSEAVIMADYLVENGVNTDSILLEMESHNTRENLIYSKALIEKHIEDSQRAADITIINDDRSVLLVEDRPKTIGILTNDFHIFRAMETAKELEMKEVYPIKAKSNGLLYIHMVMRETFAILKYKFLGYM